MFILISTYDFGDEDYSPSSTRMEGVFDTLKDAQDKMRELYDRDVAWSSDEDLSDWDKPNYIYDDSAFVGGSSYSCTQYRIFDTDKED